MRVFELSAVSTVAGEPERHDRRMWRRGPQRDMRLLLCGRPSPRRLQMTGPGAALAHFIWMTRDSDGSVLHPPSTRIVRPDRHQSADANSHVKLVRDVMRQVRQTDAAAVVLVALGFPPTAARHGVVSVHLETRVLGRRIWVAPMGCARCGVALGSFGELRDCGGVPLLLPPLQIGTLN